MEQESGGSAQLLDLLDHLRKFWWTVIAGLCFGMVFAVAALHYIPRVYEGVTKIYLAQPKIPEEYVDTTVVDDLEHRLWRMHEAVLDGPHMKDLIEAEFPDAQSAEEQAWLMRRIRDDLEVRVTPKVGYFELVYHDSDPVVAANLSNQLADLYIRQNIASRSNRAQETSETMAERAAEIGVELEARRAEIEGFKSQHRFELPEYLESNWRKLENTRADLETTRIEITNSQGRRDDLSRRLGLQQQQHSGVTVPVDLEGIDPYGSKLQLLRAELEQLLVHYSPQHPSVKQKQRELDDWIAAGPSAQSETPSGSESAEAYQPENPLLAEIRKIDREIEEYRAQEVRLQNEILGLERRIDRSPAIDQQLAALTDGYDLLEQKYLDALAKADDAGNAQWLEENLQGRQLRIIERAEAPLKPIRPEPLRVYLLGLVGGLALFVGPLLLRRFLNPVLSSEAALQALIAAPVLTSIPSIETEETRQRRYHRRRTNYGLSLVSAAVLVIVLLTFG